MEQPLSEVTPEVLRRVFEGAIENLNDDDDDDAPELSLEDLSGGVEHVLALLTSRREGRGGDEPPALDFVSLSKTDDGLRGVRFVAAASALSLDLAAVPRLVHALTWELWAMIDEDVPAPHEVMQTALARRLWRITPPRDVFERLRTHPDPALRRAVANGLDASRPDAAALRLELALHDADPCVRAVARRGLPGAMRPGWWQGAFASAEALGEPLPEAVRAGLDTLDEYIDSAPEAAFVAAFEAMSEGARHRLAAALYSPLARPTRDELLLRTLVMTTPPAGGEHGLVTVLERLRGACVSLHDYAFKKTCLGALAHAPEPARRALHDALRDYIAAFVPRVAPEYTLVGSRRTGHRFTPAVVASELYVAMLGASDDPHALLDLLLAATANHPEGDASAREGDGVHELGRTLQEALAATSPHADTLLDRYVAALEAGPSRAWGELAWVFWAALDARLAREGGRAEKVRLTEALLGKLDTAVRWALELGTDPAVLARDPRTAAAFGLDGLYRRNNLADSRARLRRGELSAAEVVDTCRSIDHGFGGLLPSYLFPKGEWNLPHEPCELEAGHIDAGLLASIPEALRGPCTPEEDAAFARAVDELLASAPPDEAAILHANRAVRLGKGPLTTPEREALVDAIARLEAQLVVATKEARHPLHHAVADCITLFAQKAVEADLPWLMALLGRAHEVDERLELVHAVLKRRFGAALPALESGRRAVAGGTWAIGTSQAPTAQHGTSAAPDEAKTMLAGLPVGVARRTLARLLEVLERDGVGAIVPELRTLGGGSRQARRAAYALVAELLQGLAWALAADPVPETWDALIAACDVSFLDDDRQGTKRLVEDALATILGRASAGPEVAKLLRHRDIAVRRAVAGGLEAHDARARGLLFELAGDPDPTVRGAALAALEGYERPWWLGVFTRDPLAELSADEAAAVAPACAEIARLFATKGGERRFGEDEWMQVVSAARALPPRLGVELIARGLRGDRFYDQHAVLLSALVRMSGGFTALAAHFDRLSPSGEHDGLERALKALAAEDVAPGDVPARREVASAALARALRAKTATSTRRLFLTLALSVWPEEDDVDALVDAMHAFHRTRDGILEAYEIREHLGARPWRPQWRAHARLFEAARAGLAHDGWAPMDSVLLRCLDARARRELALALRGSETTPLWSWAWCELTGALHEPSDAPVEALLAELVADPTSRARLLGDITLVKRAAPMLAARLRLGHADLAEAGVTLEAHRGDGAYPADLLEAWRAARDAAIAQLPAGPSEARRAFVRALPNDTFDDVARSILHRFAGDADAREAAAILFQFASCGGPDDLAVAVELVRRFPEEDHLQHWLARLRDRC